MNIQTFPEYQIATIPDDTISTIRKRREQLPIDESIVTIAKELLENTELYNHPLFLSLTKGIHSIDNEGHIYTHLNMVQNKDVKIHLFADSTRKIVRMYVSSRNPQEKNPETCESGSVKMFTIAKRFIIDLSKDHPTVKGPIEIGRLRILPNLETIEIESLISQLEKECGIYKDLSDVKEVCKLNDFTAYSGSHGKTTTKKFAMYVDKYDELLSDYVNRLREQKYAKFEVKRLLLPIFKQFLEGVAKIHVKDIIHGDLKYDNTMKKGDRIGIIDFQLSKRLNSPEMENISGTFLYLSPEIILSVVDEQVEFASNSFQSDMWATGCMLLLLQNTYRPPFMTLADILPNLLTQRESISNYIDGLTSYLPFDLLNVNVNDYTQMNVSENIITLSRIVDSCEEVMKEPMQSFSELSPQFLGSLIKEQKTEHIKEQKEKLDTAINIIQYFEEEIQSILNRLDRIGDCSDLERAIAVKQLKRLKDLTNGFINAIKCCLEKSYNALQMTPAFDDPLMEIIRRLLDPNPKTRMTASQACEAINLIP